VCDLAAQKLAYNRPGSTTPSQSSADRENKLVCVAAGSKRRGGSYAGAKKRQRMLPKSAKRKRDADSTTGQHIKQMQAEALCLQQTFASTLNPNHHLNLTHGGAIARCPLPCLSDPAVI